MEKKSKHNGLTIIEILIAIAIIAILSTGLYIAGSYAQKQAKIKLTESTIAMLSTAIEQYRDFYPAKSLFEAGITYSTLHLQSTTNPTPDPNYIGDGLVTAFVNNANQGNPGLHKDEYASIEALCYFLNQAPPAKKIIDFLNPSLLTNKSENKTQEFRFVYTVAGIPQYPLVRVVDAWGKAFRYTYKIGDNFPVITSAGPDKDFGDTIPAKKDDNITSR